MKSFLTFVSRYQLLMVAVLTTSIVIGVSLGFKFAPQPRQIAQSPTSSLTVLVSPSPLPPVSHSTAIEVPPPPPPSSQLQAPVPFSNPINTGIPENAVPNSTAPSSESATMVPPQLAATHNLPTDNMESLPPLPQGQSAQVKTNFGHLPSIIRAMQWI